MTTSNTQLETFPKDVLNQLLQSCERDINDLVGSVAYWQTMIEMGLKSKDTSLDLLGRWHNEKKAKEATLAKVIESKANVMAILNARS
jgi:hypothetical protein